MLQRAEIRKSGIAWFEAINRRLIDCGRVARFHVALAASKLCYYRQLI